MHKESEPAQDEYNHELISSEEVILPADKSKHVLKLKVRGEEYVKSVILNPYVELVNGTDLLITQGKFDALFMYLTVALKNISNLASNFVTSIEISKDGINYSRLINLKPISINSGDYTSFLSIPLRFGYPTDIQYRVPIKNNTY